jgi:membrane protease YdiL (CAAX protease family)
MGSLLVLTLGFHLRMDMGLPDSLFSAFLLATLPLLSLAQLPLLAAAELERLRAYAGSAATIAFLASVALVLGAFGPGLIEMGLGAVSLGVLARTTAALIAAAAALLAGFHVAGELGHVVESRLLRELIPRTGPEKRVFVGLSLAAGLGEELVYRGYLLALLTPVLGSAWAAAGVTSATFGVLHAYQGPLGIVRTALLGMLFATAVVMTGSLWPAVIVHTLVDLVGGLWLGQRLIRD